MSYVRENSGGKKLVEHAIPMADVEGPVEDVDAASAKDAQGPFESQQLPILNGMLHYPGARFRLLTPTADSSNPH